MRAIIFDTETTGLLLPAAVPLDQQPKIIELGALLTDGKKITGELTQLIDPEEPISSTITKITGITNSDLVGMPTFKDYYHQLAVFFLETDLLICHNAFFDKGMLANELKRINKLDEFPHPVETICTVQEYRVMFKKWPKMTELYEKIIGKPLAQTHRALDDCKALHEILVADKFFDKIGEES